MSELLKTIGRLRRAMPRNKDAMDVCDALEKHLIAPPSEPQKYEHIAVGHAFVDLGDGNTAIVPYTGKFDKAAYMREYMRQRRAKPKSDHG